ncbi:peptide-methionine (R)-S-oxide reductase MsrB [Devosia sp. SD17-2]|uniref:peptide-methionine (R)-S-oxide reductase MsrB n=1 Tax=Devosia sp. SD17-2 TaxID=2976459 RepID=UPI0023D8B612|nr:peptide-methionine (R)-S-oxide reductase MsrB [Devosia sp. SD17-2]WEJ34020.1 peptide-methionine (R)-S-oxide reductase MsrB [Devosia sp. SD17-2]
MLQTRRAFLISGTALGLVLAFGVFRLPAKVDAAEGHFDFQMSDDEWRQRLSPEAYEVLRREGTERAFTSPLNDEKRHGLYHCAGCDAALFSSDTKFDSGTGWPSFWDFIGGAIGTSEDNSLGMSRVEVHCSNCGGHQGHVFEDGPPPTGLRYCINGVALNFKAA